MCARCGAAAFPTPSVTNPVSNRVVGDEWAPLAMERRLADANVLTTIVDSIELEHAFSCNSRQTSRAAAWASEQIRDRETG